jgi:hypothetical protein
MKNFLLKSMLMFKEDNMFTLIDPTHEEITGTMEKARLKVSLFTYNGGNEPLHPVNIFSFYSGHGTSLEGRLHISAPSTLTQDEYTSQLDIMPEVRPLGELKSILTKFKDLV